MSDQMYCEHDRTEDACEECAYEKAKAAGDPRLRPYLYPPTTKVEDETPAARPARARKR